MTTPREDFISALELKKPAGRVPHFELVFFLTMEVFGKVHPLHRNYSQWNQMTQDEQNLHISDMSQLYVDIARRFEHSAIFFHQPSGWNGNTKIEQTIESLAKIREISGNDYFTMIHGDATLRMPTGSDMLEFINKIADTPDKLKSEAQSMVDTALGNAEIYRKAGVLDGFALCTDYCLNQGPFLSPAMFDEFITPYLKKLVTGYREMGVYVIKHSDGNIMPILDSIVEAKPHALHSLDPQGGIDIADIKKRIGNKICLIGNVNCGLMDTGSDEEVAESARYALRNGMPGGGYIFSTSNCVYTGMRLERYELIHNIWKNEGLYDR